VTRALRYEPTWSFFLFLSRIQAFLLVTWHILDLSIRGERSSSVLSWRFLPFFFTVKRASSIFWDFFLIRCEVKGQGCCMCPDCKALWGKFVICDIGLYKINWIELKHLQIVIQPSTQVNISIDFELNSRLQFGLQLLVHRCTSHLIRKVNTLGQKSSFKFISREQQLVVVGFWPWSRVISSLLN